MSEQQDDGWKCSIAEGRLKLCSALQECTESGGAGTRYQGIKSLTLMSMKTMQQTRTLIVCKSGDHAKRGLVMNFCPFCCGSIYQPTKADEEAA